jgi:probable phosphoglycerate mutase
LLLVRHGESTWNAEGRWQGQADPPLSPTGERQARAAAAALLGVELDAVRSSDLARAARTAAILAGPDGSVRLEPRLRERDVGAWAGLTRDELDASHPGWVTDGWRPVGWEDDRAVAARAFPALEGLAAALGAGAAALAVSHGGLIRAVEAQLGGASRPVPNLGGVWLHWVGDGFELGDRVALLEVETLAVDVAPAVPAD